MKLKRLVIQGFKSFKDRTTINFDDGITGIVGPNGCGKSNIVDALFWVMGEQSPKHLRGNTMKDVIFSGSSKYAGASYAEATLVLDNDEGKHIHIGSTVAAPSEIQLTRKLYRNGETEYRINGNPARLKDIQEVFMDTGAGAKSYSIIAQGEIARLVNAKPEDRRVMIEEVAGITKFKKRKQESLKKIEQTQMNLSRLQDLKQEIEKGLNLLEAQATKASRARELRNQIKENEVIVESYKIFEILDGYKNTDKMLQTKRDEIQGFVSQKDILEIGLEEERYQKDEKTASIENLQKEFNELSRNLAASEERLNSLMNSQVNIEKQIETRENELSELTLETQNRKERLKELQAQQEALEFPKEQGFDTSDLEERVETLKDQLSFKEAALLELKDESKKIKESSDELEKEIFKNTSKLTEMATQLEDITHEIDELEKISSGANSELLHEREETHAAHLLLETKEKEEKELQENVCELSQVVKEIETQYKHQSNELMKLKARLLGLKEVTQSLEGMQDGTKDFIKNHQDFKLLHNLIKCDEAYTNPVQNVMSDFIHTLVPPQDMNFLELDISQVTSLEMLLKTVDIETSETRTRLELVLNHDIIPIKEVLKDFSENHLQDLFKGFYIAPQLSKKEMQKLTPEIKFRGIIDKEGRHAIFNRGGTLVFRSFGESENNGTISRNNLIDKLTEEIQTLSSKVSELELELKNQNEILDKKRSLFENLRSELIIATRDYAAKKSGLESKLQGLEGNNSRLSILKNRKNEISKLRLVMLENEDKFEKHYNEMREALEDFNLRLEDDEASVVMLRENYNEALDLYRQKELEAKSFHERANNLKTQIEDIEGQIERQEGRIESNQTLINNYKKEIVDLKTESLELENKNKETANMLSDKELILSECKDELVMLLQSMQEREEEVKKLNANINKNDKEISECEYKLEQYVVNEEQITRNIFEKYKIDLRSAVGSYLEFTSPDYENFSDISNMFLVMTENGEAQISPMPYEFELKDENILRDCHEKLKNSRKEFNLLGEINWQAIEDYERQKLRFDFLNDQEGHLKTSLSDLELAISHIDEKSKDRFKIAFDEVNDRFQKVFPIIFGGGQARLKVVGDINSDECGVDIDASPPGKNMTNINLMSGGEKTLTAVSLIFSIFLVKPSPFCLLDEVDAPLDDANVGRFNELLREMSSDSQFILITHNKKTMELNDTLYGVTMQEPGVSKAVSVQLH